MPTYTVELEADYAREVYAVEADSPEEAAASWATGTLVVSEVEAGKVVNVTLDPH